MISFDLEAKPNQYQPDKLVQINLESEENKIEPSVPFELIIEIEIEKGWHIYWLNPGDAGMATKVKLNLPEGFEQGEIRYPFPRRIEEKDIVTFGYENKVNIFCEITPNKNYVAGNPFIISANVQYLVCKEVCLSQEKSTSIKLPIKQKSNFAFDLSKMERSLNNKDNIPQKIKDLSLSASSSSKGVVISINGHYKLLPKSIYFLPHENGIFSNKLDQKVSLKNGSINLFVEYDANIQNKPNFLSGILVNEDGWGGDTDPLCIKIEKELN